MKSFFSKIAVVVAGALAFLGMNFKDAKAFVPLNSQISEITPLYLQHAASILDKAVMVQDWHSSHQSHQSHYSHESHRSHYSG